MMMLMIIDVSVNFVQVGSHTQLPGRGQKQCNPISLGGGSQQI